jgi:Zn finger protein HypA/HybF involved in hydrogenase expression
MHEVAVAEEIVAASLLAIDAHGGGRRLERVHVVLGEENHIDPGILSEAFAMAATGTEASAAVLNVETPTDLCATCGADSTVPSRGVAVTAIEVAD